MRALAASLLLALAAMIGGSTLSFAQTIKIVALGDSLTAGFGLTGQEALPAQLEAALKRRGHDVEIANAGVSGDTASGGLARVDWSVPDGTDAVILALGANDMLRGVDPAVTKKALGDAIRRLRARNIDVMIAGMRAAPNLGADYAKKFDAMYEELAREYGVLLYPFLLDGVAAQRELIMADGLHPTAKGVSVMVERILPSSESLIERVKKRRG
ncbi:MAG: arylesterase [Xanthobacteraceae bacterium]|nr:arylesterase [Xanthobacteraceae bacterium]QYK44919.1 MAG: arylesterase [Xanthobacteraceae bacterium]HMN51322.1 arylesterase [Xanthobacteraceae bacterium]